MEDFKVLSVSMYDESKPAISIFSGDIVSIIGEQIVELSDGRILEQYIYNIDNYVPKNGKPFISLKGNLVLS